MDRDHPRPPTSRRHPPVPSTQPAEFAGYVLGTAGGRGRAGRTGSDSPSGARELAVSAACCAQHADDECAPGPGDARRARRPLGFGGPLGPLGPPGPGGTRGGVGTVGAVGTLHLGAALGTYGTRDTVGPLGLRRRLGPSH